MGGGDLNMKKSWHPLLLKNQERVWLEEQKAREEKKKLDQLRKEKEEERQLQELQRLQEEQTGKKRQEKLEWMYTTPAMGNSQNPNDLEDYLLGKKRIDQVMTADENAKLGSAHKNFIAVQNANSVRDIASKIREDPLLAIKQQEQASYQALLSNPLRLAQMQKQLGIKPKKDKEQRRKEKEERRREKEERKRRKHERKHGKDRSRSRSLDRDSRSASPPRRDTRDRSYDREERHRLPRRHSPQYRSSSRSPSPEPRRRHDDEGQYSRLRRYSPEGYRGRSGSATPRRDDDSDERDREPYFRRNGYSEGRNEDRRYGGKRSRSPSPRRRSPPPKRSRPEHSPLPPPRGPPPPAPRNYSNPNGSSARTREQMEADRAARLAAMSTNAGAMSEERQQRLAALLEKEKAELEADERARAKSKGMSGFLSQEQKRVFGGSGGLEDRIRRGRGGMVVDAD
ncbi:unnamed protein product [Cyclocybe aegerita]|uniref:CBF1-interacting co-repressor CIR N-terminal domain-containing protein n=1 Tax=Cyclocybe aegerita TaxID=1973307 RepID=A0A8S0W108_CYCAE|nr:unnamed protein product [Cyclocybe aegerita]